MNVFLGSWIYVRKIHSFAQMTVFLYFANTSDVF